MSDNNNTSPISKLKVTEIKKQLMDRNLSTTGLKKDLVSRLKKAINNDDKNKAIIETANKSITESTITPSSPQKNNTTSNDIKVDSKNVTPTKKNNSKKTTLKDNNNNNNNNTVEQKIDNENKQNNNNDENALQNSTQTPTKTDSKSKKKTTPSKSKKTKTTTTATAKSKKNNKTTKSTEELTKKDDNNKEIDNLKQINESKDEDIIKNKADSAIEKNHKIDQTKDSIKKINNNHQSKIKKQESNKNEAVTNKDAVNISKESITKEKPKAIPNKETKTNKSKQDLKPKITLESPTIKANKKADEKFIVTVTSPQVDQKSDTKVEKTPLTSSDTIIIGKKEVEEILKNKDHKQTEEIQERKNENTNKAISSDLDSTHNNTLLIQNLVRPLTLFQIEQIVKEHGKIKNIWLNNIKSHCYCTVILYFNK